MLLRAGARAKRVESGYTFIEVLVAGGILGFLMVALYTGFSVGFATIALSQENLRADQILLQKMETLRVYDWSKVDSSFIPTSFTNSFSTNGNVARGVTYTGTINIAPAPISESYSNTLRQVTVGVSWVSGRVVRNRSLTTFVSQNGIQTYRP